MMSFTNFVHILNINWMLLEFSESLVFCSLKNSLFQCLYLKFGFEDGYAGRTFLTG